MEDNIVAVSGWDLFLRPVLFMDIFSEDTLRNLKTPKERDL